MNRTRTSAIAVLGLALASASPAAATLIDFNDGTPGAAVAGAYSSIGIEFSNAEWTSTSLEGSSPPVALYSQNEPFGSVIPDTARVVGVFEVPVDTVSITALDVGERGARIEAYDSEVGGALLGWDELSGSGSGVGNYATLIVAAPGIRRIELFQPNDIPESGDGVQFDDLAFLGSATSAAEGGVETVSWGRLRMRFR